jgi:hypothetical protein
MILSSKVYANANPKVNDLWVSGSPIGLPVFWVGGGGEPIEFGRWRQGAIDRGRIRLDGR